MTTKDTKEESTMTHAPKKEQISNAERIWTDIKGRDVDVFAIKQKVSELCTFYPIDQEKCFITVRASAVLPALESAVMADYDVSMMEKYVVVEKKKPKLP